MATVGVRELKDRLTHYLHRTQRGEEIIVTDRGAPVAVIQPIQAATHATSLDARLAALASQGIISLPARKALRRVRRIKATGVPASRVILQTRR